MTADSLFPTSGICRAAEGFAPGGRSSRRIPAGTRTIHHARTDLTDRTDESRGHALHGMTRIEQAGQSGGNAVAEKRIDLSYDAASQWQTITRYADLAATKLVATSAYTFDAAGRLAALTHAQGATPLAGYSWTCDAGNRITEFTSLLDGTADYTYDQTDQLVDAEYDYQDDEAYDYDANGNRTMTGYVTGDNNLVLSDGNYDYEYDAEGNRTRRTHIASGEVTDYDWDHRNRLIRVSIRTTANGPLTTDILYAYDAFNRLVRVTLHTTDNGPLTTDTFHVYDVERWERGNAGDHVALAFDGNGDL